MTVTATLGAMAYSPEVIDHFEHPRNVGTLDARHPHVGNALVGSPRIGEVIRLQIQVNSATGLIEEARFRTYGNAAAIAAASLATLWLKGRAPEAAAMIRHADLARELALPPERLHSALLVTDAIQAAVDDYLNKRSVLH